MQTFLPHQNFACSALVLDRQRLNQQVNECRQIISAIRNGGGWRHHPVVKMWRDYEPALRLYHDCMVREWVRRGYVNNRPELLPPLDEIVVPEWLQGERGEALSSQYRTVLLDKNQGWYSQFGWDETAARVIDYPPPLT